MKFKRLNDNPGRGESESWTNAAKSDQYGQGEIGLHEEDDKKIWKAFKSGNESAFIFIYEQHFKGLVNYGLNFTSDRDIVLDCLQDMFIELREKRTSITETDSIKPLLFKIFRRRINHYIKSHAKIKSLHRNSLDPKFSFTLSPEQHIIDRQFDEQQSKLLNQAILSLTITEREAIFHYYFEHHSYKQIAEIMGYSQVKTARSLVYKAISSLRRIMELGE